MVPLVLLVIFYSVAAREIPNAMSYPPTSAPPSNHLTPISPPFIPGYNSPVPAPSPAFPPSSGLKGGYWPSWRSWALPASAIETAYFTHVYYAFVVPDPTTYQVVITPTDDINLPQFIGTLHSKNPPAKALLSIGGGGNDAATAAFSSMASCASTREVFIDSAISVARKYGLDGLDLDWEFPQTQTDMDNLGLLLAELRIAVTGEADATSQQPLLLTAAVYFASKFFLTNSQLYPIKAISKNLDWINAMCFDYHGAWEPTVTGAHAALFDPNSEISTSYGIESWINAGVPSQKIAMGLPLYGRSWLLKNSNVHGIGAPAVGVGPGDNGVIYFNNLMDLNAKNNATVHFDRDTGSTYSYAGTTWVSYDDQTSVYGKMKYARDKDLGGYFFWALSYDKDWVLSRQASVAWELWGMDS